MDNSKLIGDVIKRLVASTIFEESHAEAISVIGTIIAGYCEITDFDKYELLADLKEAYEHADADMMSVFGNEKGEDV